MKITLEFPDDLVEKIIRGIMDNFPESSASLRCDRWKYDALEFEFVDDEDDGMTFTLDKAKLFATLPLIFTNKWPKGCTKPPGNTDPEEWNDWLSQADAIDHDAFVQLACFGEVIYG